MERYTLYKPNQRLKDNLFETWYQMFINIVAYRELIYQLFRRDFLMTYKKSFLGIGWILLGPLIGILNWVLLNSTGVLNSGSIDIPYPAYVLLSTSLWGLFMGFFSAANGTLDAGSGFIMQVNFPHETLLVKQAFQHIVSFFITFSINILVLVLFGVFPDWKIILFPLFIIPLFALGSALGLLLAVISVVAIDIGSVVSRVIGLALYITPVIYAPDTENEILRKIIELNPLTYLIGMPRDAIIYGEFNSIGKYLFVSVISIVIFLISLRLFYVSEEQVIEKMI